MLAHHFVPSTLDMHVCSARAFRVGVASQSHHVREVFAVSSVANDTFTSRRNIVNLTSYVFAPCSSAGVLMILTAGFYLACVASCSRCILSIPLLLDHAFSYLHKDAFSFQGS